MQTLIDQENAEFMLDELAVAEKGNPFLLETDSRDYYVYFKINNAQIVDKLIGRDINSKIRAMCTGLFQPASVNGYLFKYGSDSGEFIFRLKGDAQLHARPVPEVMRTFLNAVIATLRDCNAGDESELVILAERAFLLKYGDSPEEVLKQVAVRNEDGSMRLVKNEKIQAIMRKYNQSF